MKKITYFIYLMFISFNTFGQTYSTGTIQLTNTSGLAMTLRLDIGSEVNMILTGPADRWFSVGFGATSMTAGTDVVLCHTNSTLTSFDRDLPGFAAPTVDATQNWTIISNTVSGNVRTITATRSLNTGDPNDYVFSNTPSALSIIWARATANNYSLTYHGGANRGATAVNFTLNSDLFLLSQFKMYPNPTKSIVNLSLPDGVENVNVKVYDHLGRIVDEFVTIDKIFTFNTSNYSSGSYIVKVETTENSFSKILIVE